MLRAAVEYNIEFHFLPPHTTHQLQPLDVGVFGPLQRKWQARCDEIISETNTEVPRSQFVKEYMGVRGEVFTAELIQKAWKKAGIWPRNPKKFGEKDFAPSKLMSYTTCLPPRYPGLSDTPDVLVITPGNEDEGAANSGPTDGAADSGVGSSCGEADGEGMRNGGEGNGVRESNYGDDETDVEMTGEEAEDRRDDETMDEVETNPDVRMEEPVDTCEVTGGTDALNDSGHLSRYERESHHFEQSMFAYPYSSTFSSIPPTPVSRIAKLEEEVRSLRSQLETAKLQLKMALAHSTCAGWEIKGLKERLNLKNSTKKCKVQVNAQYISSADAIRMLDEQEHEAAERRTKEEEAQAAKRQKTISGNNSVRLVTSRLPVHSTAKQEMTSSTSPSHCS